MDVSQMVVANIDKSWRFLRDAKKKLMTSIDKDAISGKSRMKANSGKAQKFIFNVGMIDILPFCDNFIYT